MPQNVLYGHVQLRHLPIHTCRQARVCTQPVCMGITLTSYKGYVVASWRDLNLGHTLRGLFIQPCCSYDPLFSRRGDISAIFYNGYKAASLADVRPCLPKPSTPASVLPISRFYYSLLFSYVSTILSMASHPIPPSESSALI